MAKNEFHGYNNRMQNPTSETLVSIQKPRRGRPSVETLELRRRTGNTRVRAESGTAVIYRFIVTKEQRQLIDQLGGAAWLRDQLAQACA